MLFGALFYMYQLSSKRAAKALIFFLFCTGAFLWSGHASAQYFGRNHVQYKRFDFNVLETNHYDIYHYQLDSSTLDNFALLSERWYYRHQNLLKDTLRAKNPIMIYKTHADFQQTTLMDENIGIGTGGVTEGLKNRVFMPFFESNQQTDHVLGHELVHAFQYNMLRSPEDSLSLNNIQNLPLWMVEGMAEYMSIGSKDALTAMWMRDAVVTQDFPNLKDLTMTNKYFPYRYGQAFWSFVGGLWGDHLIKPLFLNTAKIGYQAAVSRVLGYDETVVSSMWKLRTTEYYEQFAKDTMEVVGTSLLPDNWGGYVNITPLLSPDGKYTIFYSERDLFSINLFLVETATGRLVRTLQSGLTRAHVDDYNYIESQASWSPDSRQVAVPVLSKGNNILVIMDATSGRTLRQIRIHGLDYFNYTSWSPDGNKILIAGLKNARSDLFLYDLNTRELEQLTNDAYSEIHANWSPNGKQIIFSSDRGEDTDLKALKFGSYKITLMDVESREVEPLDFFPGANNLNPQFSSGGESIYFLSNADGFRNLYEYKTRSGELFKLTKYFTGICGITEIAPAFSVARDTHDLAYILFRAGNYYLYKAKTSDFERFPVDPDEVDFRPAMLPPVDNQETSIVAQNMKNYDIPSVIDASNFLDKPFRSKFELAAIQQSGIGIGVGSYGGGGTYTGLAGGVAGLFTDILNRNQIYGVLAVNGEIYDFGGQAMYLNRTGRIYWGGGIGHIPYLSSYWGYGIDSTDVGTPQDPEYSQDIYMQRMFVDQANLFTSFPISRTLRWEASASFAHYSFRIDRLRTYIGPRYYYAQTREKLASPPGFNLYSGMLAFVGDNAHFGLTSPMTGSRFRLEGGRTFGRLEMYNALVDGRKYFRYAPITFAIRGMYYGRLGKDADNNLMYPMFIGNEYFIRGYNYNSMTRQSANDVGFSVNNLLGTQLAIANAEIRLPFTGPERLAQIKSEFLFSDLVAFFDIGKAWEYTEQGVKYGWDDNPYVYSAGLALRVNLFGYAVIEPYMAYPFAMTNPQPTFGLHISGGGF